MAAVTTVTMVRPGRCLLTQRHRAPGVPGVSGVAPEKGRENRGLPAWIGKATGAPLSLCGPRGSGSGSAHRLVLLAPPRGPLGATPRPEGAQRAPSLARLPSSGPGVGGRGQRRASGLWVALGGLPRSSLASVLQLSRVGAQRLWAVAEPAPGRFHGSAGRLGSPRGSS